MILRQWIPWQRRRRSPPTRLITSLRVPNRQRQRKPPYQLRAVQICQGQEKSADTTFDAPDVRDGIEAFFEDSSRDPGDGTSDFGTSSVASESSDSLFQGIQISYLMILPRRSGPCLKLRNPVRIRILLRNPCPLLQILPVSCQKFREKAKK